MRPGLNDDGPRLYIPAEMDAWALHNLGVKHTVACGCKPHFHNEFSYLQLHVQDNAHAHIGRLLQPAAYFIATAIVRGENVLVHCKAGICRSATIICAYLLAHRQDLAPSPAAALELLRQARPAARPRPEFLNALEAFSNHMRWRLETARMVRRTVGPRAAPRKQRK